MIPNMLNGADLAFVGDAYYELRIRLYLLEQGITNPNKLHKRATGYVSASAHSKIVKILRSEFTVEEDSIFKRGRNFNYKHSRKNLKLEEYLASSGFEAVIGYLYLNQQNARLDEIISKSINIIEADNE